MPSLLTYCTIHFSRQKEELIANLAQSENEAKATNKLYKEKLTKLSKDYEKSKKELEEAQGKILQFQGAGKSHCFYVNLTLEVLTF